MGARSNPFPPIPRDILGVDPSCLARVEPCALEESSWRAPDVLVMTCSSVGQGKVRGSLNSSLSLADPEN